MINTHLLMLPSNEVIVYVRSQGNSVILCLYQIIENTIISNLQEHYLYLNTNDLHENLNASVEKIIIRKHCTILNIKSRLSQQTSKSWLIINEFYCLRTSMRREKSKNRKTSQTYSFAKGKRLKSIIDRCKLPKMFNLSSLPFGHENYFFDLNPQRELIVVQQQFKMVKPSNKKLKKQRQNCTICMQRSINCKTVECGHEFCYRCLSKWTRRKGNCPVCRQEVRTIHYKNKIIQPQFLKIFDEDKLMLSEQIQISQNRMYYVPYMFMSNTAVATHLSHQTQPFQMTQTPYFFPFYFGPSV